MALDVKPIYCKTNDHRETKMNKLDWTRLLGFDQIAKDRKALRDGRIGSKTGAKVGVKLGVKLGIKAGVKVIQA